MLLTIKLKTLLHSNIFYVILLIFTLLFILCKYNLDTNKSLYTLDNHEFIMEVGNYNFKGNKCKLELNGKEKLVANYYIKDKEELNYLKNNIKYGTTIYIIGDLSIPSSNTIPKSFNYKKYLNNKDIYYTLNIKKIIILDKKISFINKIKNHINKRITKIDKKGYMKAFILGDKGLIDGEVFKRYQVISVTHLFALSGMHISLLSGIILKLFKRLNKYLKYLLTIIILVFYGILVSLPSSIKRTILFFIINVINKLFKINISNLKVLYLVIFILIISNYKIIYDIGFRYSSIVVLGIILCKDFIYLNSKLKESFKLSLIANLFSIPITLTSFYSLNLLSILYNIIYIPYVSLIVYPLSLLSYLIPYIYKIFNLSIIVMEYVTGILAEINIFTLYLDFNICEVLLFYLLLYLIFYKGLYKNIFYLILIIIFDLIAPYIDSNSYMYTLDVGQGDSILILSPYKKDVLLIDTGGRASFLKTVKEENEFPAINYLKSMGIKKIDYLILTHGDFDHLGNAPSIINNFKIKNVIFNVGEYNKRELDLIKLLNNKHIPYLNNIETLKIYKNKLYFLNTKIYDNENDNSNVIYTIINNKKVLLMGDAGKAKELDIIKKYNLKDIDILKVGHHGSDTSSSKEFIETIKPKYCFISVGKKNRYGHPKESVLDTLDDYCKIYRTDLNGTIGYNFSNNVITTNRP